MFNKLIFNVWDSTKTKKGLNLAYKINSNNHNLLSVIKDNAKICLTVFNGTNCINIILWYTKL